MMSTNFCSFQNGYLPPIYPEINSTTDDSDQISSSCPEYDTAQTGNSLFEKKLLRKLTEKPTNEWLLWVKSFADKISFCHYTGVREGGIALVDRLLDFPDDSPIAHAVRDHLEELVQSGVFLDKCINLDDLAQNQAENILKRFEKAIEATAKPSKLIGIHEVPENVEVNPIFISDPRIMLYNILSKSGNTQLSPIDDTIEMKLAFILADLREQFVQRIIPQNHKDRIAQESFIKKKLQNRLSLIESREKNADVDEKIINLCYKRMSITTLMDYILKGSNDDKFNFINVDGRQDRFKVPIAKRQGYANSQILIDHVHRAINDQQKSSFKISLLKDRLQSQYENDALEKMKEYFDGKTETITKLAVKALLYSTGYLKNSILK